MFEKIRKLNLKLIFVIKYVTIMYF